MRISTVLDHIDSGHVALLVNEGPELLKIIEASG